MLTLTGQVQRASDTAKFTMVRVGEVENERVRRRRGRASTTWSAASPAPAPSSTAVPRAALDGREDAVISATIGRMPVTSRPTRLRARASRCPNFFFHVTTAYDLLRHGGVPLGKMDYIGARV